MLTEGKAISQPAARPSRDPDRRARVAAAFVAARDGDREALEQLVRELSPMLWHVARSQGLDREDAVDVVQNTWLALVTSLRSVRNPDALMGWLVTTTRREAWRVRAAGSKEQPMEVENLNLLPDDDRSAEERVLADEQRNRLWAAINQLPPRCRELMRVVAFVERPDYRAVSAALKIPRGSIGPTRGRCLAKLRQLLGSDSDGGWRWQ